jgi:hypothetical protein
MTEGRGIGVDWKWGKLKWNREWVFMTVKQKDEGLCRLKRDSTTAACCIESYATPILIKWVPAKDQVRSHTSIQYFSWVFQLKTKTDHTLLSNIVHNSAQFSILHL